MKIVFLGFQKWGWSALKGLLESRHQVALILTHPESKSTYKGSFLDESVKELAESSKIEFLESRSANQKEVVNKIKNANPDVIVSSDWETWISPEVAALAGKAAINIHDSLLPKYAGFSPVNWAIINGEKQTGITVHYIEEAFDQGKIILQKRVSIRETDTIVDLLEKIFRKIPDALLESLDLIEKGGVAAKKQDIRKASFYHKILNKDCAIDWSDSCRNIYNFIRALAEPFSNAHTYFLGEKIKIKRAYPAEKTYCGIPGRLVRKRKEGVVVLCGKTGLNQPQGLLIEEIEDSKNTIWPANKYFSKMGSYLGR